MCHKKGIYSLHVSSLLFVLTCFCIQFIQTIAALLTSLHQMELDAKDKDIKAAVKDKLLTTKDKLIQDAVSKAILLSKDMDAILLAKDNEIKSKDIEMKTKDKVWGDEIKARDDEIKIKNDTIKTRDDEIKTLRTKQCCKRNRVSDKEIPRSKKPRWCGVIIDKAFVHD
jgi:hypothetical protein